ncbi:hypothetical protein [Nocardioides albidus]|uniref:hypothetical protein n=1 Tax=Nocardioides albidus TaxID=1517589 RepID=UPI00195FC043|nr:hypothetical protein [Nocardioides albidus]
MVRRSSHLTNSGRRPERGPSNERNHDDRRAGHTPRAVARRDRGRRDPLVRLIGRTLRDAIEGGHALGVLADPQGNDGFDGGTRAGASVAVRSHDTPQAATLTFGDGTVAVSGGVRTAVDATVVVDLHGRFAPVQEPTGDAALAAAVLRVLSPPVPHWRAAAARFWEGTRTITGIPDVLVVAAETEGGVEHARFGDGESHYVVAGPADVLAGVFSGADDFLESLAAGVRVQGSLSQLSVMTAASWKVRFDV